MKENKNLEAFESFLERVNKNNKEELDKIIDDKELVEEDIINPNLIKNITIMNKQQSIEDRNKQSMGINIFLTTVICFVGIIGNLLSLKVFCSTKLPRTSSRTYLIALTITDGVFLIIHFLETTCKEIVDYYNIDFPLNIADQKINICRTIVLLRSTCRCASPWIIVAFTLERFLVVNFPNHLNIISKPLLARRLVYIVLILSVLISLYSPMLSGIIHQPRKLANSTIRSYSAYKNLILRQKRPLFDDLNLERMLFIRSCDILPNYRSIYIYLTLFYTIIVIMLPLIIISIFNALLIIRLYKSSDQWTSAKLELHEQEMSYKELRDKKVQIENFKITWMLIIISLSFIVLTLPYAIFYFIHHISNLSRSGSRPPPSNILGPILKITELLNISNHSINFFLYTVTRNSFRKVLKEKLRCDCLNIKGYMVDSTSTVKQTSSSFKLGGLTNIANSSFGQPSSLMHSSDGTSEKVPVKRLNDIVEASEEQKSLKDSKKQQVLQPEDYESYWQTVPLNENSTHSNKSQLDENNKSKKNKSIERPIKLALFKKNLK